MTKKQLKEKIEDLKGSEAHEKIGKRVKQFKDLHRKGNGEWLDELCFCILTANSSADKGIEIQSYMKERDGFKEYSEEKVSEVLEDMGYRFYNRRAEYISLAREYSDKLKDRVTSIKDSFDKRECNR